MVDVKTKTLYQRVQEENPESLFLDFFRDINGSLHVDERRRDEFEEMYGGSPSAQEARVQYRADLRAELRGEATQETTANKPADGYFVPETLEEQLAEFGPDDDLSHRTPEQHDLAREIAGSMVSYIHKIARLMENGQYTARRDGVPYRLATKGLDIEHDELVSEGIISVIENLHKYKAGSGASPQSYLSQRAAGSMYRAALKNQSHLSTPESMIELCYDMDETSRSKQIREKTKQFTSRKKDLPLEVILSMVESGLRKNQQSMQSRLLYQDPELSGHMEESNNPFHDSLATEGTPEESYMIIERKEILETLLAPLTDDQKTVIRLRNGYTGKDYTLKRIADTLGKTHERIRQIENRALGRLRHRARSLFGLREKSWELDDNLSQAVDDGYFVVFNDFLTRAMHPEWYNQDDLTRATHRECYAQNQDAQNQKTSHMPVPAYAFRALCIATDDEYFSLKEHTDKIFTTAYDDSVLGGGVFAMSQAKFIERHGITDINHLPLSVQQDLVSADSSRFEELGPKFRKIREQIAARKSLWE